MHKKHKEWVLVFYCPILRWVLVPHYLNFEPRLLVYFPLSVPLYLGLWGVKIEVTDYEYFTQKNDSFNDAYQYPKSLFKIFPLPQKLCFWLQNFALALTVSLIRLALRLVFRSKPSFLRRVPRDYEQALRVVQQNKKVNLFFGSWGKYSMGRLNITPHLKY